MKNKIYTLSERGLSLRKIAKEVGLSYQRVSQILNNKPGTKSRHRIYIDTQVLIKNNFYEKRASLVLNRLLNSYSTTEGDCLLEGMEVLKGDFWVSVTYPISSEPERYYMKNGKRMPVPNDYPDEDFIFV